MGDEATRFVEGRAGGARGGWGAGPLLAVPFGTCGGGGVSCEGGFRLFQGWGRKRGFLGENGGHRVWVEVAPWGVCGAGPVFSQAPGGAGTASERALTFHRGEGGRLWAHPGRKVRVETGYAKGAGPGMG